MKTLSLHLHMDGNEDRVYTCIWMVMKTQSVHLHMDGNEDIKCTLACG